MKTQYLNIREAATHLGLKPQTLYNWRVSGRGPKFYLLTNGLSRYALADLDAWAQQRSATSTSSKGVAA